MNRDDADIQMSDGREEVVQVVRVTKDDLTGASSEQIIGSTDHTSTGNDNEGETSYTQSQQTRRVRERKTRYGPPPLRLSRVGLSVNENDTSQWSSSAGVDQQHQQNPQFSTVESVVYGSDGEQERRVLSCMDLNAPYPVDSIGRRIKMDGDSESHQQHERYESQQSRTYDYRERREHRMRQRRSASHTRSDQADQGVKVRHRRWETLNDDAGGGVEYRKHPGRRAITTAYSNFFAPESMRQNSGQRRNRQRQVSHDCNCCHHCHHHHCNSAGYCMPCGHHDGTGSVVYGRPATTIVYDAKPPPPSASIIYQPKTLNEELLQQQQARYSHYSVASPPMSQPIHVVTQPVPSFQPIYYSPSPFSPNQQHTIYSAPPIPTGPRGFGDSMTVMSSTVDPALMSIEYITATVDDEFYSLLTEDDTEAIRRMAQKALMQGEKEQATASILKHWLDDHFGKDWNVIVSNDSFGSNVGCLPGSLVHLKEGELVFLVWKV